MPVQPVVFDNKSFLRYLAFVEKNEQKFVMAKTLTQIAAQARKILQDDSRSKWTVRSPGVLRGYQFDVATKQKLESVVGHLDWYAVDQLDDSPSDRRPLNTKWRWIPLSGVKKTKRGRIPRRLSPERLVPKTNKRNSKLFFFDSKQKNARFLAKRKTKKRLPITMLYKLVPKQRIMPVVSINKASEKAASTGQEKFNKNMTKALKPFR